MGTLDGRVAIITGAGRGLGREHALLFAAEGAKIVVNDLGGANDGSGSDMTPAQQTVADIKGMGGEAIVNTDNVADWDGAKRMIDSAIEAFGDLDILVNNAGITKDNLFMRMSDEEWASVLDVNLTATMRLCKGVVRGMMKARWGRIVNISSIVGATGNPGQANYAASKAGMVGMSKSIAYEVASRGITVNCVAPGFIATAMTDKLTDEQKVALQAYQKACGDVEAPVAESWRQKFKKFFP